MIDERELDRRLDDWVREYGVGGLPRVSSKNFLVAIQDHKGFVPSKAGFLTVVLNTKADEVERGVKALANTRGNPGTPNYPFRSAWCLRAYYLSPKHWPEVERLHALARIGLVLGKKNYYIGVQYAKAYLMGCL